MKHLNNYEEFILEKSNIPTSYEFTSKKAEDQVHNRLASKEDDGHKWEKNGDKKTGKASRVQKFKCKCGYTKTITNDEGKSVVVKYGKS